MTRKAADTRHAPPAPAPAATGRLRRWLPFALLILLGAAGYALGLDRFISLEALARNREELRLWVDGHLGLALAGFMLLYTAAVALSLPVASALSIAGGFLFGWALSVPATVLSAVAGAAIVFQIVKTSFGAALAARSGPFVARLADGFAANAFSLLLFLRLTPVFPFWAVNAVAGLSGVPLRVFVAATAIGIIPASFAFALVGEGLDRAIDAQLAAQTACAAAKGMANCPFTLEASALLSPALLLGLTGLGIVALIPLALRLWKRKRA